MRTIAAMHGAVAHRIDELIRACYSTNDAWPVTRDQLLGRLRTIVPIDAAFVATADPETLLFSSAWAEEPLPVLGLAFLDNEFGAVPDVNRFCDLARAERPVVTLDNATHGDRMSSARSRTLMAPIGLGDELRVVLRTSHATWGFMCLHREGASPFTSAEVTAVEHVAPHLAEAVRRATVALVSSGGEDALVICDDGIIIACTDHGAEVLESIDCPVELGDPVPLVLLAVVRRLEVLEREPHARSASASAMVTSRHGTLVEVHASRLVGPAGTRAVALTMMSPSGVSLVAHRLATFGFTPAQARVAKLVLSGRSTREIMGELQISQHTVQDHMKAIFDRVGVRSRRELVATMMH
jgi:DNA-binding CsgD family transcriptional regulator